VCLVIGNIDSLLWGEVLADAADDMLLNDETALSGGLVQEIAWGPITGHHGLWPHHCRRLRRQRRVHRSE
jgi:hypothetical protein